MSEHPVHDEIRAAAAQVAAIEDAHVINFGGCIARLYKQERMAILGLIGIDAMVSGIEKPHDELDPRLVAVRVYDPRPCSLVRAGGTVIRGRADGAPSRSGMRWVSGR